jgi:hypothetical protein
MQKWAYHLCDLQEDDEGLSYGIGQFLGLGLSWAWYDRRKSHWEGCGHGWHTLPRGLNGIFSLMTQASLGLLVE